MPGRDVKHQGASEPSGFRQKFSRRSLGRCFLSALGGASPPARQPGAGAPPPSACPRDPAFLQAPPRDPTPDVPVQRYAPQRRPATSLASVFLWNKTMPMWVLRVPPLARHARGSGVGRAPVALALPAEAIESRGLLARLCLGPLDGRTEREWELRALLGRRGSPTPRGPRPGHAQSLPSPQAGHAPHVSQVSSQAPPPGPTAAGEVAELSLHLWVRGIAPGPLGPIRIPAIVVVQIFVKEPGGAAGREQGPGAQDQCGPFRIPGSALRVLGPPLARPRDAEPAYTHLPGSKGCACGRCRSQR